MEHIQELKWHYCPPKWRALWVKLIDRKDLPKINDNTRVCSNHFVLGKPIGKHPHPSLYMQGYSGKDKPDIQRIINGSQDGDEGTGPGRAKQTSVEAACSPQRKKVKPAVLAKEPKNEPETPELKTEPESPEPWDHGSIMTESDMEAEAEAPYITSSYSLSHHQDEHNYCVNPTRPCSCSCSSCQTCRTKSGKDGDGPAASRVDCDAEENSPGTTFLPRYDVSVLRQSDELMHLHTGLKNYAQFQWLLQQVQSKLASSFPTGPIKTTNPEAPRKLTPDNELLLTLMKLKLNLSHRFLAHLFGLGTSVVPQILSTWLPLLSQELQPLIYWPSHEELHLYYPACFKNYEHIRAIIDCIEVPLAKDPQNQEQRSARLLVACTPAGTVAFVSKTTEANMSDEELARMSGFGDLLEREDVLLGRRGFDIQELLLDKGAYLVTPSFLSSNTQLPEVDNRREKQVASARIHVERVMDRMKEFDIMKCELPADMLDVLDHVVVVVAALVNLQPPLAPL